MLDLKRGGHARVQTEMVEFIALPYPSSNKKLKIWSFHVVVVQGRRRNVEKSVMHVQSYRCRRRRCFVRSLFPIMWSEKDWDSGEPNAESNAITTGRHYLLKKAVNRSF